MKINTPRIITIKFETFDVHKLILKEWRKRATVNRLFNQILTTNHQLYLNFIYKVKFLGESMVKTLTDTSLYKKHDFPRKKLCAMVRCMYTSTNDLTDNIIMLSQAHDSEYFSHFLKKKNALWHAWYHKKKKNFGLYKPFLNTMLLVQAIFSLHLVSGLPNFSSIVIPVK